MDHFIPSFLIWFEDSDVLILLHLTAHNNIPSKHEE
jgi:hypothetical protein